MKIIIFEVVKSKAMEVIVTSREDMKEIISECLDAYFKKGSTNDHALTTPGKLLNQKEICDFLRITEPTLIRWKKRGKIPFIEMGGIIRFDPAAVAKALEK